MTNKADSYYEAEPIVEKEPPVMSLLLVDDVASTRKIIRRTFEFRNNSCEEAGDGVEAIAAYKSRLESGLRFDAIVLDKCMPNMDGPECCRQLRALGYAGIIFGVTGHVMQEDIRNFKAAGVTKVLEKPISFDIFINEYNTAFGNNLYDA